MILEEEIDEVLGEPGNVSEWLPSIDLARLRSVNGVTITDSSKSNEIIVNSTSDPSNNEIDCHDQKISFREAIHIARYLKDQNYGETPLIKFKDQPL